jgi:hypothetical protein
VKPHRTFVLLALVAAAPLSAQTVRGNIVDESTRLPVPAVLITLVDAGGAELPGGVRSDTLGNFVIHAARSGTYRVKAVRIGYRPQTSEAIVLDIGQLAIVRFRMTTQAQQLIPVRVVERRQLSLSELMSSAGFDYRQSKGVGQFVNADKLAEYRLEGTGEVLRRYLAPTVEAVDSPSGPYLVIVPRPCIPEIYLDGTFLQAQDSGQTAYSILEGIPSNELHGIEAYRGQQIPPPSVGGLFGERQGFQRPCGVIAVWTKKGRRLATTAARGPGLTGIQVLRGTVLDFDTGKPVAGVPVTMLTAARDKLADPVRSDSLGEFIIRTRRVGSVRLEMGDVGRGEATTPPFPVSPEELIVVKLFVSGKTPVMAPLGIVARELPGARAITDLASFAYRRERGLTGVFFGVDDIRTRGAATVADLIRGVDGIIIAGAAPADTILMRRTVVGPQPRCRPTFFINGAQLMTSVESTLKSLGMARVFGVEIYVNPSQVPPVHADAIEDCGMIGIWTRK